MKVVIARVVIKSITAAPWGIGRVAGIYLRPLADRGSLDDEVDSGRSRGGPGKGLASSENGHLLRRLQTPGADYKVRRLTT